MDSSSSPMTTPVCGVTLILTLQASMDMNLSMNLQVLAHGPAMFILGKSQLQTEMVLSTFHAEYIMLPSTFLQLIPLQHIAQDFVCCLGAAETKTPTILAKVFKDNCSTCLLATNQHLTECSHWLNCKPAGHQSAFD